MQVPIETRDYGDLQEIKQVAVLAAFDKRLVGFRPVLDFVAGFQVFRSMRRRIRLMAARSSPTAAPAATGRQERATGTLERSTSALQSGGSADPTRRRS
jgi:hypothetical protein